MENGGTTQDEERTDAPQRKLLAVQAEHSVRDALDLLPLEVIYCDSENAFGYLEDDTIAAFMLDNFDDELFDKIRLFNKPIYGPPIVKECVKSQTPLPDKDRPIYNTCMKGMVVCLAGFKNKQEIIQMMDVVRFMGGSVYQHMEKQITHLVSKSSRSRKYSLAIIEDIPILSEQWVLDSWERRNDPNFDPNASDFLAMNILKPFTDVRISFYGFTPEERRHMEEVLEKHGGEPVDIDSTRLTHVVVDELNLPQVPDTIPQKSYVVKSEWFWMTVQQEKLVVEDDYLIKRIAFSTNFHKFSLELGETLSDPDISFQESPQVKHIKRSLDEQKIAKQLNQTTRENIFLELLQTETNYVNILNTILMIRDEALVEGQSGGALLDNREGKIIFGTLPAIRDTHRAMLHDLNQLSTQWEEDVNIGQVLIKYYPNFRLHYPPYINYFENCKHLLQECDATKPRFHAFLRIWRTRPECGRQSLHELMIRPVQRLGSIILLLRELVKATPTDNLDHGSLDDALTQICEVVSLINEDKRRTESLCQIFDIFNLIEDCAPNLISSHRNLVHQFEVIELKDTISNKGDHLMFFIFTDLIVVCKKRQKAVMANSFTTQTKLFRHLKSIPLSNIRKVIRVTETKEVKNTFALSVRSKSDLIDVVICCAYLGDIDTRDESLKILARTMANNACTASADNYIVEQSPEAFDIKTSQVTSSTPLSKAASLAFKSRLLVSHAFGLARPGLLRAAAKLQPMTASNAMLPHYKSTTELSKFPSCSNITQLKVNTPVKKQAQSLNNRALQF